MGAGRPVRPTARRGPYGDGRQGWRDRRGFASAGGSRASWPGDGCWAERCACSRVSLHCRQLLGWCSLVRERWSASCGAGQLPVGLVRAVRRAVTRSSRLPTARPDQIHQGICSTNHGQHETAGPSRRSSGYGPSGGTVKLADSGPVPQTIRDHATRRRRCLRAAWSCGKCRKVVSVRHARLGTTESPGATILRRHSVSAARAVAVPTSPHLWITSVDGRRGPIGARGNTE